VYQNDPLSREQMQSILEDPQGSDLVDEKAKALLRLATKMTNESYKIIPEDIEALRRMGFSDEVILER
jgi:alkylhydroperoxidase family enzyme